MDGNIAQLGMGEDVPFQVQNRWKKGEGKKAKATSQVSSTWPMHKVAHFKKRRKARKPGSCHIMQDLQVEEPGDYPVAIT